MNIFYFLNVLFSASIVMSQHLDRRGAKGGAPAPAPVPGNNKGGGGKPGGCGTSFCDVDLLTPNAIAAGTWHVPDINSLPATSWNTNQVHAGTLTTIVGTSVSKIKYGGFCSGIQKSLSFLLSTVPNPPIAAPSWIANIPAGDVDASGSYIGGFSYKIDVLAADITAMNAAAAFCKNDCFNTPGCKYASYGWEAPAGWFCKKFTVGACLDTVLWWKPAPPTLGTGALGGASGASGTIGGCRITDTIATNTPFLNAGSSKIAQTTPYTASLPFLTAPVGTTIVGSVKCDVVGGITAGWPTFGTVWL